MIGFGVLLVFTGFGSVALHYMDYHFRLLAWADDMQPTFGWVAGFAGLAVLVAAVLLRQRDKGEPQVAGPEQHPQDAAPNAPYGQQQGQPQYNPQPQYDQQRHGQPQPGYPAQAPGSAPQGYPAQGRPGQSFGPRS